MTFSENVAENASQIKEFLVVNKIV
jgi:hypothetical protein